MSPVGAGRARIPRTGPAPSRAEFVECLQGSDAYRRGARDRREYIEGSLDRLYRAFRNLTNSTAAVGGPTLDVASASGILYPAVRGLLPDCLPYEATDIVATALHFDGTDIPCTKFECERDRLPHGDGSLGLVLFFDCLEHLVVDPVWTLLEFNRVLKPGGHLAIATPNAVGADRLGMILRGQGAASEACIRPSSIYQRHNREWTVQEVCEALAGIGFGGFEYSTNAGVLRWHERAALHLARLLHVARIPVFGFGPELFVLAQKQEHVTLDMDLADERRWPAWLYTADPAYHRRPQTFPIVVGDDYT